MFGWLKRRVLKEHLKLLWQNDAVSSDPELKTRLLFGGDHELADRLDEIGSEASRMYAGGVPSAGLSNHQFELGISLNRELRRTFEVGYVLGPSKFDPKYTPLGGWEFYYERNWPS